MHFMYWLIVESSVCKTKINIAALLQHIIRSRICIQARRIDRVFTIWCYSAVGSLLVADFNFVVVPSSSHCLMLNLFDQMYESQRAIATRIFSCINFNFHNSYLNYLIKSYISGASGPKIRQITRWLDHRIDKFLLLFSSAYRHNERTVQWYVKSGKALWFWLLVEHSLIND